MEKGSAIEPRESPPATPPSPPGTQPGPPLNPLTGRPFPASAIPRPQGRAASAVG